MHLQALINMLDMPTASHELSAALLSVLHNVALGSADGCVLMLQGGIAMAATALLSSNGPHDDQQDAQVAALIQQICMKVQQAEVREDDLTGMALLCGPALILPYHAKRHRGPSMCLHSNGDRASAL